MRKLTVMLLIVLVVVLGLGTVLVLRWVQDIPYAVAESAEFRANVADVGGVDTASSFTISFSEPVSAASVNKCLTVSPQIELGLHQGDSRSEVLVVPAEPLQPQTIYTFTLQIEEGDCVWSIQTKAPLAITATSPADQAVLVDTKAPLMITLNQLLSIDLGCVDEFVSISPDIAGGFSQSGRTLLFQPAEGWKPGTVYRVEIAAGLPLENSDVTLAEGVSFAFETFSPALQADNSKWAISGQDAYTRLAAPQFKISVYHDANLLSAGDEADNGKQYVLNATVQLYQYDDMLGYAQALLQSRAEHPAWSRGRQNLSDCDLSRASLRSTMPVTLSGSGDSLALVWPTVPPAGYYLLRLTYLGQTRDLLFAVSDINAALVVGSRQSLLWLHDSLSGEPVTATVTGLNGGLTVRAGNNGLALLDTWPEEEVYLISAGESTLALPQAPAGEDTGNYANWRYLYIDKTAYANGDTLHFFGLVLPRDGSKLEYERVSVYIYPAGSDAYVYQDYAPLSGNVFSGSIQLPTLNDGIYSLQIWQSGKLLAEREFGCGQAALSAALPAAAAAQTAVSLDRPGGYAVGDSFQATLPIAGGDYLFWEAGGGAINSAVGDSGVYLGRFTPENALNQYVYAMHWDGGRYTAFAPARLALDYGARALKLELDAPHSYTAGVSSGFTLAVYDQAGNPVAGAQVAVSVVVADSAPATDVLATIYGDYQPSGFGDGTPVAAYGISGVRATDYFTVLTTDESGRAASELTIAGESGTRYLLAQVIKAGNNAEVSAGTLVSGIQVIANKPAAMEPPPAEARHYDYHIRPLTDYSVLNTADGEVLVFSGENRLRLLSLLLDAALAEDDPQRGGRADLALAAAHARQLLVDYGGDYFGALFTGPEINGGSYQKENGGLGDTAGTADLALSVRAAALAPAGVAHYSLQAYFRHILEQPADRLQACQALAGLAIYGRPVLTEIRLLLSEDDLKPGERLWLIWGLYQCGDLATAYRELESADLTRAEMSADELALLAVLYACRGSLGDALYTLVDAREQSGEDNAYAVESVLVARLLLPKAAQTAGAFSYTAGGQTITVEIGQNMDYLLSLNLLQGDIRFHTDTKDLYYCYIYRLWDSVSEQDTENADAVED